MIYIYDHAHLISLKHGVISMETSNLIQVLIYSIFLGGIYAITAIGLNLIFGVMKIVNFSHGVLVMLGAYFGFWIWKLYGISPYISTVFVLSFSWL